MVKTKKKDGKKADGNDKLSAKKYAKELRKLQVELCFSKTGSSRKDSGSSWFSRATPPARGG